MEGKLDYSDPEVQRKVETLLQTFENSSYIEGRFYTESWLRDWASFVETSAPLLDMDVSTPDLWLDGFKSVRQSPDLQDLGFREGEARHRSLRGTRGLEGAIWTCCGVVFGCRCAEVVR